MVKVNRAFEEAYEIYNLVNDQQKMVGNASFCRDKLVSVIVTLNTATDYFQAMKRFVQSHGQPVIGFKMIPADDETRTYEDMVASWPRSALDVSHPVALEGRKGAIILSTNDACR